MMQRDVVDTQPLSRLALAAAVLCVIPMTFPLGVIVAIVAMLRISRLRQRGMSLVFGGLGTGAILLVCTALLLQSLWWYSGRSIAGANPPTTAPQNASTSEAQSDSVLEAARRQRCAANLRKLANAFKMYAQENNDCWPALVLGHDHEAKPLKIPGAIDTQNSLWLLVVSSKATADLLTCPSDKNAAPFVGQAKPDNPFPRVNDAGKPDPAGKKRCWSYSYQIPNGPIGNPGVANADCARFAVMSDRAPFNADLELPPASVTTADEARKWLLDNPGKATRINSPNHAGQGQNVLFQDGHAKWHADPWCGIGGDNIFTRANEVTELGRVIGIKCGVNQLPDTDDDSVLVNIDKGIYCTPP